MYKPENENGDAKGFLEKIKDGARIFKNYKEDNSLLNSVSKTLNHYRVLDDVTNGFFKIYDFLDENKSHIPTPFRGFDIPPKTPHSLYDKVLKEWNYKKNQKVDLSRYAGDGFINDQGSVNSKMAELRYGLRDMDETGCELIAVYNSLNSLNDRKNIFDISKEFENDGRVLYGIFGTSPYSLGDYFRKNGYDVQTYDEEEQIQKMNIPKADSYILSFWNNDNFTSAIHTVSISPQADGSFKVYNSNGKDVKTVSSIKQFLDEQQTKGRRIPLVLHCISRKGGY